MDTIILSSNNGHKRREIEGILRAIDVDIEICQPYELGFSFEVAETGTSFAANCALKAWGLYDLLRGTVRDGVSVDLDPKEVTRLVKARFGTDLPPVLADDSGLCVTALDNDPGIYSARFGSDRPHPPTNDEERNTLLIEEMASHEVRDARYVCNAMLILEEQDWFQTERTWHGEILQERQPGNTGFGYDPIVSLPAYRCSVAQLPQGQKDRISHRAQAIGALMRAIER